MEEYLAVQPPAGERIEFAIAYLHSTYINAHRRSGSPEVKVETLMPYRKAWERLLMSKRYSDLDQEVLAALGGR